MIYIQMDGAYVVLGVQWLESLGMVSFNFQQLFMKFSLEGKGFELKRYHRETWKVDNL